MGNVVLLSLWFSGSTGTCVSSCGVRDHCSPPAVTSAVRLSAPSRLGGAGAGSSPRRDRPHPPSACRHNRHGSPLPPLPHLYPPLPPRPYRIFLGPQCLFNPCHTLYGLHDGGGGGVWGGVWGSGSAEVSDVNLLDLWPLQTIVGFRNEVKWPPGVGPAEQPHFVF